MPKNEEHVDFVAREGVALYTGRGITAHQPGHNVRLPKSHADALAHLSARAAASGPIKLTDGAKSN